MTKKLEAWKAWLKAQNLSETAAFNIAFVPRRTALKVVSGELTRVAIQFRLSCLFSEETPEGGVALKIFSLTQTEMFEYTGKKAVDSDLISAEFVAKAQIQSWRENKELPLNYLRLRLGSGQSQNWRKLIPQVSKHLGITVPQTSDSSENVRQDDTGLGGLSPTPTDLQKFGENLQDISVFLQNLGQLSEEERRDILKKFLPELQTNLNLIQAHMSDNFRSAIGRLSNSNLNF